MQAIREIIATELETQQLRDQSQIQSSFEFRVPKGNIPHLLISVIHTRVVYRKPPIIVKLQSQTPIRILNVIPHYLSLAQATLLEVCHWQ